MIKAKMVQHPVGQGGLFCGELRGGGRPLRWVYDCGSNQPDELSREIMAVGEGGKIDLLFLSHLDSDHACGVDKLLLNGKVREVVLPYLSDAMLLATVARDDSTGRLTGSFIEAANDLARWFGSRGVDRITFVGGGEGDEGSDGPIVPGDPGRGPEGDIEPKWSLEPVKVAQFSATFDQAEPMTDHPAAMQQVALGAAVLPRTPNAFLNWVLIPYVHAPSAKLMKAFEQALEEEFGSPLDKKAILRSAKDTQVRERLRVCYDALWGDHNLISMTLYAGPRTTGVSALFISPFPRMRRQGVRPGGGGWMLTGDAHLDGKRRRQRFLSFYRDYTPLTSVLMMPHHGSVHNHSDLLLTDMPKLVVGYAAAGQNQYGHPHRDVAEAVDAHEEAHFRQVSEERSTKLVIDVVL